MGAEIMLREARPSEFGRLGDLYVEAYVEFVPDIGPERWVGMQLNLRRVAQRAAYSEPAASSQRNACAAPAATARPPWGW